MKSIEFFRLKSFVITNFFSIFSYENIHLPLIYLLYLHRRIPGRAEWETPVCALCRGFWSVGLVPLGPVQAHEKASQTPPAGAAISRLHALADAQFQALIFNSIFASGEMLILVLLLRRFLSEKKLFLLPQAF